MPCWLVVVLAATSANESLPGLIVLVPTPEFAGPSADCTSSLPPELDDVCRAEVGGTFDRLGLELGVVLTVVVLGLCEVADVLLGTACPIDPEVLAV